MRWAALSGALGLLCASCGSTTEQPAPADSTGSEVASVPLRIGIPTELRPENRPEEPSAEPVTQPAAADPDPAPAEPSEEPPIAAWEYLRAARQHVAHTYRAEIQRCFDEGHARAPLSGRLVVAMVPHADGRVASSRVVENGTADAEVGECVARAARGWALPPPPRRTLEVQLRFTA